MNNCFVGFLLGTSVGIGMLLSPQIRNWVDKTSLKIQKKIKKLQEKTEE